MILQPRDSGWLEVICGPMFSGKTEELIRRLKRARYAGQNHQNFKPSLDDRYDDDAIVSHDARELDSIAVDGVDEIRDHLEPDVEVVGIDEAQFFDDGLRRLCDELAGEGVRVVVAGLDLDYMGRPFGPMPSLLVSAEYVSKLLAICVRCGDPAAYTYRLSEDPQQVLVGADDEYEARCRSCFYDGYPTTSDSET